MPKIERPNEFQSPTPGTHGAYLVGIYDIGTQPGSVKFPKPKRQVKLCFELPFETRMVEGVERPLQQWATYALSCYDNSKFKPVFEALFKGTPTEDDYYDIDFNKLIGNPCSINIIQNGEYVNVAQVTPLTKGMTLPPVVGEFKVFDLDKFDQAVYDSLGEKMKEKIANSPEFKKLEDAVFVSPADTYTDGEPLPF